MKKVVLLFVLFAAAYFAHSQGMPVLKWGKFSYTTQKFESVTSDKWGNVFCVGEYYGTQDFDPGTGVFNMTSNGQSDVFIVKLDSSGNFIWAKSLGGASFDTVYSAHVDTFGNIITVGSMKSSGDFDPGPAVYTIGSSTEQIFISKLDLNGNFAWAKTFNNTYNNGYQIGSFDVDKDANIYVFGHYHDTVDIDPGPGIYYLYDSLGGIDGSLFLLKLNSSGNFVWVNDFHNFWGGATDLMPYSVKVDNNNNVVVTGYADGNVSINNTYLLSDMFIVKFNSAGVYQWSNNITASFGGNYFPLNGITTDKYGSVFVVINSLNELDFPNGFILYNGNWNCKLAIVKYNSSGSFSWAKQVDDIYPQMDFCLNNNNCVAVDSNNDLVIAGVFSHTVDFDMGPGVHNLTSSLFNPTQEAAFLYKIDTAGNYKWAYKPSLGEFSSVSIDKKGRIYVVGLIDSGYALRYTDDPCAIYKLTLDSISPIKCGGTSGYLAVTAHDGTLPYNYLWNSGQTTPSFSMNNGGIYKVVVHDAVGCVDSASYIISNLQNLSSFDMNVNFINAANLFTLSSNYISLDAFNDGCSAQSGSVTLVLDSLLSYWGAAPSPSQVNADTVVWNYSGMNYNSGHFQPQVVFTPMGNLGDTVCVTAIIDPITGDADTTNNVKTSCYVIVGSFDPNDITVYPQGACDSGYVLPTTTFTYTIDFQNTGNAAAANIYILDSLDAHLDLNTLEVVGSSHTMYTEVLPNHVLKFHFDNIQLPYSNLDDSLSHGYLIYQIKAKSNIPMGSLVKNHAAIFFDNNPPVITNEVFNKVVATIPNCNTSVHDVPKMVFHLSPNPAKDIVTIQTLQSGSLEITDLTGRMILQSPIQASTTLSYPSKSQIDVSGLSAGVYVYRFVTDDGASAQGKLVIMR